MKVSFYIDSDKDVLAVFPEEYYNWELYNVNMLTCYEHIGQHSACHVDCLKDLRKATKEEYTKLLNELIFIGYEDLEIV